VSHFRYCLFAIFLLLADTIFAQTNLSKSPDSITVSKKEIIIEKDITDLIRRGAKKDRHKIISATDTTDNQRLFSFIPAAGYSLQTGLAGILSANLAYFNGTANNQKISSISASFTYTQYNQTIVPLVINIWTKNNRYNFISDNRYIDYPSNIYGIGGRTNPNKGHQIAFYALKFHQTLLKSIANNLYAGVGYYYDQFWSIKVLDSVTKRMNALINRQLGTGETASSIALKLMYDNRLNQINAKNGWYVNLVYRDSYKFLGSDNNWQSLLVDIRKYIPFPKHSKNTLALWSFNWLTLGGTVPYLLLPSTGWDDQYNTGRGYIQGRFRGKNMSYFESEYRFNISRNGFLGGVLFGNLQYFSPDISAQFQVLSPGYGGGLRIKLNKHSGANLCIDYGFGKDGSRGFFVNLGEVF
jgi:outer membrane protein assembly factor BamA